MVAFSNLPGEIILLFADQLTSDRDISSLARTSRDIYGLVNPHLYRLQTRELPPRSLCWAVKHDSAGTAEKIFAAGLDPCTRLDASLNFQPPILAAAYHGSVEVTKLLLRTEGVDPEVRMGTNKPPVSHAAAEGHLEVLRLFLADPRVHPDGRDRCIRSALSHAAENRHRASVELLLRDERIDPALVDWEGRTPIVWAAGSNEDNTDVLRLLLDDSRVDVNHADRFDLTALHLACASENLATVCLLLDAGADVRARKPRDTTPLHTSAACGVGLPILERLLAAPGVDPNARDWAGRTALMITLDVYHEICDTSMVARLLDDERVRPNIMDDEGMTALVISAMHGNCVNVRALLARNDIDVNLGAERQQFVLHKAIRSRDAMTVEALLDDDRLDTLTKDEMGWTPFLIAVHGSSPKVVRLLLESGRCSLDDHVGERGHAWSIAVARGHNAVGALLVEFRDEFSFVDEVPKINDGPLFDDQYYDSEALY